MLQEIKEDYGSLVANELSDDYNGSVLVVLSKGGVVHECVIGSVSDAQQVVYFALNAETGGYDSAVLKETTKAIDFNSFDEYMSGDKWQSKMVWFECNLPFIGMGIVALIVLYGIGLRFFSS